MQRPKFKNKGNLFGTISGISLSKKFLWYLQKDQIIITLFIISKKMLQDIDMHSSRVFPLLILTLY
jgi:hypothetical protein